MRYHQVHRQQRKKFDINKAKPSLVKPALRTFPEFFRKVFKEI